MSRIKNFFSLLETVFNSKRLRTILGALIFFVGVFGYLFYIAEPNINNFGDGIDMGQINFDGDTLKSTREILNDKDCIVSRITDKNGNTRISQIEYPLIYADKQEWKQKT